MLFQIFKVLNLNMTNVTMYKIETNQYEFNSEVLILCRVEFDKRNPINASTKIMPI